MGFDHEEYEFFVNYSKSRGFKEYSAYFPACQP